MRENNILQILREGRYTVVLSGIGLMAESGYPLLRDGAESYEIEDKYGYSYEEIFSSGFYSARKELFFRFYKEVILKAVEIPPGKGFHMLKKLQDCGLVDSIITRRIAGLEDRAGCGNVVNMKGTVFDNVCPSCGKHYPVEYIRESSCRAPPSGVPVRGDDRQRHYDKSSGRSGKSGCAPCARSQPEFSAVQSAAAVLYGHGADPCDRIGALYRPESRLCRVWEMR